MLEDIEDFILLKGFTSLTSTSQIKKKIQGQLERDRNLDYWLSGEAEEAAQRDPKAPTDGLEPNALERGKIEDKKREFMYKFRPDRPRDDTIPIWNFIEQDNATPHVLRPDVQPTRSYEDGRVEELLDLIEKLAVHLKNYNEPKWNMLNNLTQRIFEDTHKAKEEELKAK